MSCKHLSSRPRCRQPASWSNSPINMCHGGSNEPEECRQLAAIEPDEDDQAFWLRVAGEWEKLANLGCRPRELNFTPQSSRLAEFDGLGISFKICLVVCSA